MKPRFYYRDGRSAHHLGHLLRVVAHERVDQHKAELRDVGSKRGVGKVWVAELEGKIVGTVTMWPPGAPRSEAWLP